MTDRRPARKGVWRPACQRGHSGRRQQEPCQASVAHRSRYRRYELARKLLNLTWHANCWCQLARKLLRKPAYIVRANLACSGAIKAETLLGNCQPRRNNACSESSSTLDTQTHASGSSGLAAGAVRGTFRYCNLVARLSTHIWQDDTNYGQQRQGPGWCRCSEDTAQLAGAETRSNSTAYIHAGRGTIG
jgi:hypothetical protein